MTVDIEAQIACVKREIHARETRFAQWLAAHTITQRVADKELTEMRAVLSTLERVQAEQRPPMFPLASAATCWASSGASWTGRCRST